MNGYLGTYVSSLGPCQNCALLSSNPHVRDKHLRMQEEFYLGTERKGMVPEKITGRYKKVAEYVRDELQVILTDTDRFLRFKEVGGGFDVSMIRRVFLTLPIQDERDRINSLADGWLANAELLAEDAQVILEWAKNNAEGPVSVI